jgi:hypothetical protein
MSTELKGKVKEKLWVRTVCTDDSEPFRLGQKARRDFKKHCRIEEREPIDVASADVFDEAFELLEVSSK